MRARICLLALVAAAAISMVPAQAPDCDGISPVLNTHPDLIGELNTVLIANGLAFPVYATAAPGDNDRLFVLEKPGRVRVITNGVLQATSFLDINPIVLGGTSPSNEQGLLGLAFHPDYQNNGFFYVFYTATSPSNASTVRRYTRLTPDQADAGSGVQIFQVSHPIGNHNAGMIEFSPIDGHLYVGTGDGGSGCDPGGFPGNAQNLNSLLGKMHRLDVDGGFPYATGGNPFDGGTPGADEIWDYGLRNPWRWSFDRITGAQYIGDVGQNSREELNCKLGGVAPTNWGWNAYEGDLCDTCGEWAPACPIPLDDLAAPYRDYSLAGTPCSVIGGYVYRGCRMPDLHGTYFYSDYCGFGSSQYIKTLQTDGFCDVSAAPDTNRSADLDPAGALSIITISSYGEDNQGELYVMDQGGGEVFKIVPDMSIMQTSGPGATPLLFDAAGDMIWEDLEESSEIPVSRYKVYRADEATGVFDCQAFTTTPTYDDLDDPLSGEVFYYLITALDTGFVESTAGADSNGDVRVVDTASSCL